MAMNWGQLSAQLTMNSYSRQLPFIGQFELTTRCNFGCRMCYACSGLSHLSLKERELSAGTWIRLAKEALEAGTLFLLLTGGEIFYREDFREIYEEISRMGFIVSLYSNGSLITEKVMNWLGRIPPAQIDISLYGASPETYKRVCGNAEGFQRTLDGIRRLKDVGINVQIRTTVIRENAADIDRMIEIAEDFDLKLNLTDYVSPGRETGRKDTGRLSPAEQARLLKKMDAYYNREEPEFKLEDLYEDKETFHRALECFRAYENSGSFPCNSGKNSYFITWEGKMIPCPILNIPQSYPVTQGFTNAWKDLTIKCSEVPTCRTCDKCSLKENCNSCPGRLLNETGSFQEPALYLCELTRENRKLYYEKEDEYEGLYNTKH